MISAYWWTDERDKHEVPFVELVCFLVAYPDAVLEFVVRRFNTIEPHALEQGERLSVCVGAYLPDAEDQRYEGAKCTHDVNLSRFLPPRVMNMLREEGIIFARELSKIPGHRVVNERRIPVRAFSGAGQEISNVLQRPVRVILWQQGDPPTAQVEDSFIPQA